MSCWYSDILMQIVDVKEKMCHSYRVVNLTEFWCSMKISKHAPDISWSRLFLCKKWSYCTRISDRFQESYGQTGLAMVLQPNNKRRLRATSGREQHIQWDRQDIDKTDLEKDVCLISFWRCVRLKADSKLCRTYYDSACMCVCGSVTGKALGTQLSVEAFGKKQTSNVVLGCLGIFLVYCSTCIWKTTGKNRTGLHRKPLKSLKHTWTQAVWTTLNQHRSDHVEQVHMLKILDSDILQSIYIWYYVTMFVCPTKKVTTQETAHVQLVSDLSARGLVTCAICEGKILATYTPRAMLSILLHPFARSNVRNCS